MSLTGITADGRGDANITGDGEFGTPRGDVTVRLSPAGRVRWTAEEPGLGGDYLYGPTCSTTASRSFYIDPNTNQLDFDSAWGKSGGGSGSADGEFNKPRAVDAQDGVNGHVFVVEELGRRVQEFTDDGEFVGKFGSTSAADPLYLMGPTGLSRRRPGRRRRDGLRRGSRLGGQVPLVRRRLEPGHPHGQLGDGGGPVHVPLEQRHRPERLPLGDRLGEP